MTSPFLDEQNLVLSKYEISHIQIVSYLRLKLIIIQITLSQYRIDLNIINNNRNSEKRLLTNLMN